MQICHSSKKIVKKFSPCLLSLTIGSLALSSNVNAADITSALQSGSTIKVNFRLRYEDVQWDGLKDSDALTLRTRLTYQSGNWNGFGLGLEMDDVHEVDNKVDYRLWPKDTANPGTAIISDPEGTDLNQAFVTYSTFNDTIKVGRQRINLDNQRFIGGAGWRQNEQTFDGVTFTDKTIRYTNIFIAHINNVNRVFGDVLEAKSPAPLGDYKQDSNLVNVSYTGFEAGKLTAYAYLIDNLADPYLVKAAAAKGAALSSDTYGVRWSSTVNPAFIYNLEYASQKSAHDNPLKYDATYELVEVGTKLGRFTPLLGYEVLSSDKGVKAFQTPFATLHAFNGWVDRFLTTPANGLKDMYLNVGATALGTQFNVSYHDYKSDVKSMHYGTELNLSASRKFGAVTYLVKYGSFKNDNFPEKIGAVNLKSDATKYWLQADWSF